MAVTALVVFVGHNSLRYLLSQDGNAGTTLAITTAGAGGPTDVLVASVQGPIKKIAQVVANGYGTFAAGAQTQAKARALWLSDTSGANPAAGNPAGSQSLVPLATCRLASAESAAQVAANAGIPWRVDAGIDGGGNPVINITAPSGISSCYLDIETQNAIGA